MNILSSALKKRVGFPILRILILMRLGSGALLDFAVAPYEGKETGEQALLRRLLPHLRAGDILLGDANFENYFLLATILQARADVVFEKNGSRIIDFRKCYQKLSNKDGLFKLKKPHKRLQHSRTQARRLKQYQGKAA